MPELVLFLDIQNTRVSGIPFNGFRGIKDSIFNSFDELFR